MVVTRFCGEIGICVDELVWAFTMHGPLQQHHTAFFKEAVSPPAQTETTASAQSTSSNRPGSPKASVKTSPKPSPKPTWQKKPENKPEVKTEPSAAGPSIADSTNATSTEEKLGNERFEIHLVAVQYKIS